MDDGLAALYLYVLGIDVDTRRLHVAVEGQCLIEFVRHVQPHVFGQSAVVGIEVAVAPLVFGVGGPFAVVPVVVGAHGHHVVAAIIYIRCQVESHGHGAVFVQAQVVAVQVEVGSLAYTLKFHKHLLVFGRLGQAEMLAVPGDSVGQVLDVHFEHLVFVVRPWQGHFLPVGIGVITLFSSLKVAYVQQPLGVEIVLFAVVALGHSQYR